MRESSSQRSAVAITPRVVDVIAELRAQHNTWRSEAQGLARLLEEARTAVDQHADAIIAAARREVERALVGARQELSELAALRKSAARLEDSSPSTPIVDVAPISEPAPEPAARLDETPDDAAESILQIQRDLHRLLREASDIEKRVASPVATPAPSGSSPVPSPVPVERGGGPRVLLRATSRQPDLFSDRHVPLRSSWKGQLIVAAALGGVAVAGGAWWWLPGSLRGATTISGAVSPSRPALSAATPSATASPAVPIDRARSSASASPSASRRYSIWLIVEMRRPAWIESSLDGEAPQKRLYQTGERRRLMATRSISVVAGDAGAVAVSFNGARPTVLGRDGQTVSRTFTIDDAERIAAAQARREDTSRVSVVAKENQDGVSAGAGTTKPISSPMNPGDAADASARSLGPAPTDPRAEIMTSSQRWLDAYYRRDDFGMRGAAVQEGANVSDERSPDARLPDGISNVARTLDGVQLDVRGQTALLRARMTEEATTTGGEFVRRVSEVSQVWQRLADRWWLTSVRIFSTDR